MVAPLSQIGHLIERKAYALVLLNELYYPSDMTHGWYEEDRREISEECVRLGISPRQGLSAYTNIALFKDTVRFSR